MRMDFTLPFKRWGRFLADLFFPPLCLGCQAMLESPTALPLVCPNCLNSLTPLPEDFPQIHILNRLHPCYLDDLWIAFEFSEVIRALLHSIKYQKMPRQGMRVGGYAGHILSTQLQSAGEALVLPVPLHPLRAKEREYNQSALIARGIFENLENEIVENLLVRRRYTSSQTRLNRMRRKLNVKNAFAVGEEIPLADRAVILVDDVVTTGATLNECARVLKERGAKRVTGMALATPVHGE